jgi:alginate production protein
MKAKLGMMWFAVLAVALGTGLPVVAADVTNDRRDSVLADASPVRADVGWESLRRGELAKGKMAQFQLPKAGQGEGKPARQLPKRLTYQYSFGSESEVLYRNDPDLNRRVRDNSLIFIPEVNGAVIYRPTDWLETTLEMILEREFVGQEEDAILLPDGEIQITPSRRFSLLVDQAFVTIKEFAAPFEFHVGRRNYEDERHWLYDASLDIASISLRKGHVRAEASVGREVLWDLDLFRREEKDRINTYMLYAEYRGIEDIKFAAYTIFRDDRARKEGRPLLMGVSGQGTPSENFSFWTQFAYVLGSDESKRDFSAYAFEFGGTYRYLDIPFHPNVTLSYASATGDGNPNDNRNTEFRQTGLQSNEAKFSGVSDFKIYGETLDPELSNLEILTVGFGFRPASNVTVDLVYHRYRLNEIADEIRNSAITALMNQDDTQLSKKVGRAFDIVLGVRNLFGVRRLGMDWRMGWFFPGKAFRTGEGDPDNPTFRPADNGSSIVAKFWW